MTPNNTTAENSKGGTWLMALAVLIAVGGVFAFALLVDQPAAVRFGILIGSLAVGCGLGWISAPGKQFAAYVRDSYYELRRVVWPTRKETVNTTGIVCAFVVIVAFFLFIVDKLVELVIYDFLLKLF